MSRVARHHGCISLLSSLLRRKQLIVEVDWRVGHVISRASGTGSTALRSGFRVHVDHHARRFSSSVGDFNVEGQATTGNDRAKPNPGEPTGSRKQQVFPSGDLVYSKPSGWAALMVGLRVLLAMPWRRVTPNSVLKLRLYGPVLEQLQGGFTQSLALPQICESFVKAAYDPRIAGIFLQVEPLVCGWGKLDEIRRHIEFYKKSGKFIVGYMPLGGEKEYYLARACPELYVPPGALISLRGLKVQAPFLGGVFEKVGIEPQVHRIGKYKSFGDQLARKEMTEAHREMATELLDDMFENWLQQIASSTGKSKEDVEALVDAGTFEPEKLKEGGWITGVTYADEIEDMLKKRIGANEAIPLQFVDHRFYGWVKPSTLGLGGGPDRIAVLRAVGIIRRVQSRLGASGAEGIYSDKFIEKLRQVGESKKFKAVVLRIDSSGGDALASDLIWREIRLLAKKKPVVVSMADVAASGGYYLAMAAPVVVAERLTLTGSIGVVTAKPSLRGLYDRVGFNKETIVRGKFADLDSEHRPFTPEEEKYYSRIVMEIYKSFRDKAALSRGMEIAEMENVAQGRVWTGKAATGRGLVDAIGGITKAVAIAKQQAGIPDSTKVTLVELSRRQPSPMAMLRGVTAALTAMYEFCRTGSVAQLVHQLMDGGALVEDFITLSKGGVHAREELADVEGSGGEFLEGLKEVVTCDIKDATK